MPYHLAIDIGASSGRHILGHLQGGKMVLEEVYRFENNPIVKNGVLCWDARSLFEHILHGMQLCRRIGKTPSTMGIDTWAVDFALLDAHGAVLGETVAYRDGRTQGMDAVLQQSISESELYRITGIQKQPFNTVYQLLALREKQPEILEKARYFLMIPDYFHYLLTGVMANEYTNATTTSLVNAYKKSWDFPLLQKLGLPCGMFSLPMKMAGERLGGLRKSIREEVGFDCTVLLPATHDTASAFLAVPAQHDHTVSISSGTWSLLGVEQNHPITTEKSRLANFTNEGGYQYRYRFLKNIMGLWMLQSIRRNLDRRYSYPQLAQMALKASSFDGQVDVNASCFLAPDDMLEAVVSHCKRSGGKVPQDLSQILQCVYRSLAICYRDTVAQLGELTEKKYTCIHLVGGGAKDDYLNAMTARFTGLPVFAGPIEGTALGNLAVQWIATGACRDLEQARELIRTSFEIRSFAP